ncbi:MAG: RraA family protein [Albidovulum sp.]|nr:RraA family protein [Albidovulum sp.]
MTRNNSTGSRGDRVDSAVAEFKESFYSGLISDVLDSLGLMQQALSPDIRPIDDSLKLVGRARTMLYAAVYAPPRPDENPYVLEIQLVDDLKPGDVAVAACGGSRRIAPWGGLLSTASTMRGAVGALMDGSVRDIRDIRELGFPVFAKGIAPLDSWGRGKVIEIDVPVEVGGVLIRAGDIVFGDVDGCIIIPRDRVDEVLDRGREKLVAENKTQQALQEGRLLADVYEEFGVL